MKRVLPILLFLTTCNLLFSQAHKSILQEESEYYQKFKYSKEEEWDNYWETISPKSATMAQKATSCSLGNKRVFGWHPYWLSSTVHNNYQWNLLSDLCYFDYTISPTTGNNTNGSFNWSSSSAVTAAKNNGKKISFCATLFSSHATFFGSATAKQTFINNCISLLQSRGGHGVNLDFEGVPSSSKASMTAFIQDFSNQLKAAIPGAEVTMAIYSVDWNSVFDIPNLKNYVDLFIIMGYDYYYSGSSQAGPNGPLYTFQTGYNYSQSRSISYYLKQGLPANKLLLAVPYYGRKWQTVSDAIPSATVGGSANSSSVTYKSMRDNTNGWYNNMKWNNASFTQYFTYQSGGNWYQLWIDDSLSLAKKYDIVNQQGIGGIGMWTLGYDDGYPELWNAIRDKLSDCKLTLCTDSIFDMGGPERNHYDNEQYTYTITPGENVLTTLNFTQFELETGYDSLWLYDGSSINAPLIGSYSGTSGPGTIQSSGTSITLRFKSDGATVKHGFKAIYSCSPEDTLPPSTWVIAPNWVAGNFTANFTDTDVNAAIEQRFYSVHDYKNGMWRANKNNGFFMDDFVKTTIHADWTDKLGTWTSSSGRLVQSEQANTNTRISASVNQNNATAFLYHFKAKMGGTGTNRRAGLHFMCSSSNLPNRGNSYFIYSRLDGGGKLQIYETVNDTFYLKTDIVYPFIADVDYDFKVIYNKTTGRIDVYVNDILVSSWTDSTPLTSGQYISFRSGECNFNIDFIEVFKNRTETANILVGTATSNDIRYLNANPSQAAGRIFSLVTDANQFISTLNGSNLNVDWSKPNKPSVVRDGLAADIATTTSTSQLSANWNTATDPNSGIVSYYYAIGTTQGGSQTVPWTELGNLTSITHSGLSLQLNKTYYFSVKSVNSAGLVSQMISSNGQKVIAGVDKGSDKKNIQEDGALASCTIFPNPAKNTFNITYELLLPSTVSIELFDISGKNIVTLKNSIEMTSGNYTHAVDLTEYHLQSGLYFVSVRIDDNIHILKISLH